MVKGHYSAEQAGQQTSKVQPESLRHAVMNVIACIYKPNKEVRDFSAACKKLSANRRDETGNQKIQKNCCQKCRKKIIQQISIELFTTYKDRITACLVSKNHTSPNDSSNKED